MRFGIAMKIAAFASALVVLTVLLMREWVIHFSTGILVNHELQDLADETLLRGHELVEFVQVMREDVLYLAGSPAAAGLLRAQAEADQKDPITGRSADEWRDALEKELADLLAANAAEAKFAQSGQKIEPRYLRIELVTADESPRRVAHFDMDGPRLLSELVDVPAGALFERWPELRHREGPRRRVWVSDVELWQDAEEPNVQPLIVLHGGAAVADPKGEELGFLIATMDFAPMADSLQRSPRQLGFVTDNQGAFLSHPDRGRQLGGNGKPGQIQSALPSLTPVFEPKSDPAAQAERVRKLSTAGAVDRGDVVKRHNPFPEDLVFWTVIGHMDEHVDRIRLADALAEQAKLYPPLRYSRQLSRDVVRLVISGPDKNELTKIAQRIGSQFGIDFGQPRECRNFAVHFYKLPIDPHDPTGFLGFAMAASYEEIEADAREQLTELRWWVPMLAGAGIVLASLFSLVITRPLKRITEATSRLAQGEFEVALPASRRDEIGILANSFRDMAQQIHQRERDLMERQTRLDVILQTAAEGVITCDVRGAIEQFNQSAERIFGYTMQQAQGLNVRDLIGQPLASESSGAEPSSVSLVEALMVDGHEGIGHRRDGSTFPLELSASEVRLDGQHFYTIIVRDITERKESEAQIKTLNEHLENRVRERTFELQQANSELARAHEAAQAASRAKDVFLATVSHELRTPLNHVSGYCQLLELTDLDDAQRADLSKIRGAGDHLLALINDILDYQKIILGSIPLELEDFEIQPLIRELCEAMSFKAAERNNQLIVQCDDDLGNWHADKRRVRQVLLNLLSNACKFTSQGTISVQVSKTAGPDPMIRVRVRDTGKGMNRDQLSRLFQPFTKVSDRGENPEGTGLGLVICKGICERMSGRIVVESEPGVGTTFIAEIPAVVPEVAGDRHRQSGGESADRHRASGGENKDRHRASGGENKDRHRQSGGESADRHRSGSDEPAERLTSADKRHPEPTATVSSQTILVIDDDPNVRDLMRRFLEKQGFSIETAASGTEGLELAKRRHPAAITLDAVMPGIDGWAVLAALKTDRDTADIPVIMVTMVDHKDRGYALGVADYVTKPVDWDRLGEILNRYRHDSGNRKVLVVEDEANSRELFRRLLVDDGWEVLEAADGQQALDLLAHERPALILADLMMPVMDGFTMIEALRQHPDWRTIPVIVVTAKDLREEDRDRLNGAVAQIIQKGAFDREHLLAEIHQWVQRFLPPTEAAPLPPEEESQPAD